MKQRPIPSTIEHKLLKIVLHKPIWAAQLPLDLINGEQPAGAALHAIAQAIAHGELAAAGFGVMIEFFRGTAHEPLVAALATTSEDELDLASLEAVFNDAIVHLQQTQLTAEIEKLKEQARQGLNLEERQRLTYLLAKKRSVSLDAADTLL
jgi:hypothetical protein